MRQSEVLEVFKQQQRPTHALHVFFDLDTGYEVVNVENYGHLQVQWESKHSFWTQWGSENRTFKIRIHSKTGCFWHMVFEWSITFENRTKTFGFPTVNIKWSWLIYHLKTGHHSKSRQGRPFKIRTRPDFVSPLYYQSKTRCNSNTEHSKSEF